MDIRDFLARHLNDHVESARGVRQPTFYTWSETHVKQAVEVALSFLYSLIPDRFGRMETFELEDEECVLSFCDKCNKFLGLVNVEIDGKKCLDLEERDAKTNNLFKFLNNKCSDAEDTISTYTWVYVDNSACIVRFDKPLPKGAIISYLCAKPPELEDLESDYLKEYLSIVAEYAAFWLFRTDSESVSNLQRAAQHFEAVKFLVQTKLLIEFSLREDDYIYGQRKVDDRQR